MSARFEEITFVTTDWLIERLGKPGLAIVDGSWHLPPTGRSGPREYAAGHIPGAVFFDIDVVSDHASGLPHMMPSDAQFAEAVGAMGISTADHVVVYDQTGLFSGPRVAWMFKVFGSAEVSILEGGLPRWLAEGKPVTTETPTPRPSAYAAKLDAGVVATLAEIETSLKAGTRLVIDARPGPRFRGEAPEPRPGVRSGHIPGSVNLPFDKISSDGALKSPADIRAALAEAGIDPATPAITSCGSGVSAAIIALALASVGSKVEAVYDGSWAEWGARSDLPLGTGPGRKTA
jgi:thiosulfate/3-mercaptopyruvate sulfurtransferase